jgi:hypothetical protein
VWVDGNDPLLMEIASRLWTMMACRGRWDGLPWSTYHATTRSILFQYNKNVLSRMVWVLFGQYMFSRGHNCFTNPLTTTLYDVKTTIYRTSSCPHMINLAPIPQERASHLVWVLFGRYMFSSAGACSAVFTKTSRLLATTL